MVGLLLTAVLAVWVVHALALRTMARAPSLRDRTPELPPGTSWPTLSVVVACRDEQAAVEQAVASLLAQDYPTLNVVAVDDRSTDETGAILDRLATRDVRLTAVHVRELPAGWLGKTHALAAGAAAAGGEWFLFTDADVMFAPDALRRAVAQATADSTAHLVVLPRFHAPGVLERGFVAVFGLFFLVDARVHQLDRPGSSAFVGAGAFNLVRADAYRAIGGHQRLALEVVDDVKLGLLLRRSGFRQRCIDAGGLVRVRWQDGFVASMRGLVKNFFAGLEYRWTLALITVVGLPLLTTFPLVALCVGRTWWIRLLAAAAFALPAWLLGRLARRLAGGSGWEGLLLPVVGLCLAAVSLISATAATGRGCIVWRGTRYSLADLRARCVRASQWPHHGSVG